MVFEYSLLPMSFCSNGTYFPCKNMVEGEVMGSKLITRMCNLPITKKKKPSDQAEIVSYLY